VCNSCCSGCAAANSREHSSYSNPFCAAAVAAASVGGLVALVVLLSCVVFTSTASLVPLVVSMLICSYGLLHSCIFMLVVC
jgi:hypothetical protein